MSTSRKTPEAAAYLGVSPSFLNKDRAKGGKGRVAYRRVGRSVIYDDPDVDAYKASTRVEPKRGTSNTSDTAT